MGYYSFYRIIKDIVRNFKKNKFLVIVAIIILLIFLSNKVFASTSFTINPLNTDYEISVNENISKYYCIFITGYVPERNSSFVNTFISSSPVTLKVVGDEYRVNEMNVPYFASSTSSRGKKPISWFDEYINSSFTFDSTTDFWSYVCKTNEKNYIISNYELKDNNGNTIYNPTKFPQVTTSLEDLQTLNFDTISVSAWDWSNKDLYILFYDRSLMNNQDTQGLYPKKEIKLAKDTSYYVPEISTEKNAIYWVANDNTGLNFKVGGKYEIRLAERVPQSTGRWLSW